MRPPFRLAECKYYTKYLDWSMPLIVCGDFNEEPSNPTASYWVKNFDIYITDVITSV